MKKKSVVLLLIICMFTMIFVGCNKKADKRTDKPKKVISTYISLWNYRLNPFTIDSEKYTHAYLSFATIGENNTVQFLDGKVEEAKTVDIIQKIRQAHPDLKLCIAVGGYAAEGFSDMASTEESRQAFCDNLLKMVKDLDLDGVDIDWEFPVNGCWGQIKHKPEDKENFTLLMKDLRANLDKLGKETGKKYELSFAAAAQSWGTEIVDIKAVEPYVDYVNLMGYDYTGAWSQKTSHNSPLYKDSRDKDSYCVDDSVNEYLKAGLPKDKLVMGVPAYGYKWTGVKDVNNGLYQEGKGVTPQEEVFTYKDIKSKYVGKEGFERYWSEDSKVPYLFNGSEFITYDDEESIGIKVDYVNDQDLAGVMLWEYSQDNGDILNTIFNKLK